MYGRCLKHHNDGCTEVVIDRRPSEGNNSVPMLSRLTSSALKLDYSTHYGWIQLCQYYSYNDACVTIVDIAVRTTVPNDFNSRKAFKS